MLTFNDDYIHSWQPFHRFQEMLQDGGYAFVHHEAWTPEPTFTLRKAVEALDVQFVLGEYTSSSGLLTSFVQTRSGSLVVMRNHRGMLFVDIASKTQDEIPRLVQKLREAVPPYALPKDEGTRIAVNFVNVKNNYQRFIDVAKWADVERNYPATVRTQLQPFMADSFRPSGSGQLLLWHGLPGTGKTWALRALAWEWRKWASMLYVVDPEMFFGDAIYMMQTLMSAGNNPYAPDYGDEDEDATPRKERWNLIVAEDTGELLSADAKARSGQGLSRLLNLVDGLIGQGLRVVVLITTNEALGVLHPAVTRPGRAAGIIEFGAFNSEEANQWLAAHGRQSRKNQKPVTLAELYNQKEKSPDRKVGFAA